MSRKSVICRVWKLARCSVSSILQQKGWKVICREEQQEEQEDVQHTLVSNDHNAKQCRKDKYAKSRSRVCPQSSIS
jgi:hypothetical protein